MKINQKIFDILKEFNLNADDSICYLISIYHDLKPSYIPDMLKQRIYATGIIIIKEGNLHWNIPLFSDQVTGFEWIETEYVPLFKEANPQRGGKVRESVKRMKKLFAENPEIRKEEVIGATNFYLLNTDYLYIRFPHYFIEKGVGAAKTSDLLDWIDKYRANTERAEGRESASITMKT